MNSFLPSLPTTLIRLPPSSLAGLGHRFFQVSQLIIQFIPFTSLLIAFMNKKNLVVLRRHLEIIFKFLGTYLAWSFSTADRLGIRINHYNFLKKSFSLEQIQLLSNDGIPIWSRQVDSDLFSMVLLYSDGFYMEGELALSFCCNSVKLHTLAFTVAPGRVLGMPDGEIILIGASQGGAGVTGQTRHTAKANGEIAPSAMLIIALQSMAAGLGIGTIIGIPSHEQVSRRVHAKPREYLSTYDELWASNGGIEMNGFYHLPTEIHGKPMELVSRCHRSRARQKRALKQEVYKNITNSLEQIRGAGDSACLSGCPRLAVDPTPQ